jgi:hypothetical protein
MAAGADGRLPLTKALLGAVLGVVCGAVASVVLLAAGPWLLRWIQGGPRFAVEHWVYYIGFILGAGLGGLIGALVGATGALLHALKTRDTHAAP